MARSVLSNEATKLLGELKQRVTEAQSAVETLHTDWDKYLRYYEGEQTEDIKLDVELASDFIALNLIFSHGETKVAILGDNRPTWYVASPDEEHDKPAEGLTEALQAQWREKDAATDYQMVLRDQVLLGTGVLKAWWDPLLGPLVPDAGSKSPEAFKRAGDVNISWLDPYTVFPDPVATSLEQCEYLAISNDLAGDRAKRLYDDFDEDRAEPLSLTEQQPEGVWARAKNWFSTKIGMVPSFERRLFRVWEVYREAGAKLTIYSGEQVLFDGPNPTPGSRFPIVIFPAYVRGRDFWGLAETKQIKGLQDTINVTLFRILEHIRFTTNSQWLSSDASFKPSLDPGKVLLYTARQGADKPERTVPPPLPPYVYNILQALLEFVDTVTGVHDVTRGVKPGSIQSGIAIQTLQETANTRLRDLARHNARSLEKVGQLVLEFMQAKYEEERTIVYAQEASPKRVSVTPEMLRKPVQSLGEGEGAPEEGQTVPVEYRVVVEPEGDMPLTGLAQAELGMQLYDKRDQFGVPVIDAEALLNALKFRGRREVLQRREQAQQAQMQGQMQAMGEQQAQMGAAGGPAPAGAAPPGAEGGGATPEQFGAQAEQVLGAEGAAMLGQVVASLMAGTGLTPEQEMWMQSLGPEELAFVKWVLDQVQYQGATAGSPGV